MLTIRDEQVRILAQDLMRRTGAPTMTAAIRLALENEIARLDEKTPLRERVEELRRRVLSDAMVSKGPPLTKEERDALWER